jgi:hypothetical protein
MALTHKAIVAINPISAGNRYVRSPTANTVRTSQKKVELTELFQRLCEEEKIAGRA